MQLRHHAGSNCNTHDASDAIRQCHRYPLPSSMHTPMPPTWTQGRPHWPQPRDAHRALRHHRALCRIACLPHRTQGVDRRTVGRVRGRHHRGGVDPGAWERPAACTPHPQRRAMGGQPRALCAQADGARGEAHTAWRMAAWGGTVGGGMRHAPRGMHVQQAPIVPLRTSGACREEVGGMHLNTLLHTSMHASRGSVLLGAACRIPGTCRPAACTRARHCRMCCI